MKEENVFNTVPEINYSEEAIPIDAAEFEKTVRSRRSVRVYTDEEIPEEITRRCLSMALLAPNSSNLQPWEFYWVRTPEKRDELVHTCLGQSAAKTAAELIVCIGRTETYRKHCRQMIKTMEESGREIPKIIRDYYEKLAPFVYNLGPFGLFGLMKRLIVPLIGLFRPIPRIPSSGADMRLWAGKSVALACENLMLAFRANGYDTCPMEGFDEKRVKKLLNLPKDAFCVMVVSAGKRSDKGVYGPQIRFPESQFLFEV
jgi:nitroreductase